MAYFIRILAQSMLFLVVCHICVSRFSSSILFFRKNLPPNECFGLVVHSVSQKKSPLRTCGKFPKTVRNFSTKFYVPIMRSYLC